MPRFTIVICGASIAEGGIDLKAPRLRSDTERIIMTLCRQLHNCRDASTSLRRWTSTPTGTGPSNDPIINRFLLKWRPK
ncbi:hypothetical protein BDZ45DRAFT_752544 [Acephala macrosclerotiorum]|nr:hypothetical protein BDZ45DRAFT_752544 [Acephala macrosclerotiorum]